MQFFHFVMTHRVNVSLEIVIIGVRTADQIESVAEISVHILPESGVQKDDVGHLLYTDDTVRIVA